MKIGIPLWPQIIPLSLYGRSIIPSETISIGPLSGDSTLRLMIVTVNELSEVQQELFSKLYSESIHALKVTYRDVESILPWFNGVSESDFYRY